MPVAAVNGQQISYEDNETAGPAIIWSHGFLMDHTMFDAQVEALGDRYRCVRWDERGFGGTPATGPFSYWDSADDAVALLDHLEIGQAVFAGMSQGGFLSLRAALAHPDRVSGLILIDTQAGVDPPEANAGYEAKVGHWMSDEPLGEVGQFVAGLLLNEPELNERWIAIWESRRGPQMEFAAHALLSRDDITGRVGEIACPALVVHGEDDQAITMDLAESLEASLQDCRGLLRVAGAAHAPNMTHPDQVNAAIDAFLAGL